MAKALILISCSDEKSTHQETHFKKSAINENLTTHNFSNLLQRRKSIKNFIQSGRVFDLLIKGEYRSERESNRMLSDGPDFNGSENEPGYLPAYKRYNGRFYNKLKSKHYLRAEKLGYEILIMSGLYGFVSPFDSIQNYNCHMTDIILNNDSNDLTNSLQKFWTETLTGLIQDFVSKNNISFIIDLLSEESYQKSIDWKRIQKVQIRHRIFRNTAGSSILPKTREFFVNEILEREPVKLVKFLEPGYPINRDYLGDDQIAFESEIGSEYGYAREAQKFDKNLYDSLGKKWDILSELDKNALRLSEEIYQKFDQSDYKRQIATAYIQTCWGVLENKRKKLLKSLMDSYTHSGLSIKDEKIKLKEKTYSFSFIRKDILHNDCRTFQAYKSILLFKHSLAEDRSSTKFGSFIKKKLGESIINKFISNYDDLRDKRNMYKAIPQAQEKDIQTIKMDLDWFRNKFLSRQDAPMILMDEFLRKLYPQQII